MLNDAIVKSNDKQRLKVLLKNRRALVKEGK